MDLSIIIPTFNEQDNIKKIVKKIQTVINPINISHEIWFIDDSVDETPRLLNLLAKQFPEIHYLHREQARGLGTAVVEGIKRSQGKYLIVMDADLQHPPELLPEIVQKLIQGIDIVIPSRFIKNGSDGGLNLVRKLVSRIARTIGYILITQLRNITDCTSGYFGLNRSVINNVTLNPLSWKILMEILVKGRYVSVQEIPYHFVARQFGKSKMGLQEQWRYLQHIATLLWNRQTK